MRAFRLFRLFRVLKLKKEELGLMLFVIVMWSSWELASLPCPQGSWRQASPRCCRRRERLGDGRA